MKRAFTLIELLVVIAIIAILAAILFPVFAQAKAAAKKTADLSNQKQLVTSNLIYSNDADDSAMAFPYAGRWSTPSYQNRELGPWWTDRLLPYTKSKALYSNPGNTDTLYDTTGYWKPGATSATDTDTTHFYRVTQSFNHLLSHADKSPDNPGAASMTAPEDPADTVMLGPSQNYFTFSSCVMEGGQKHFVWNISVGGWGYELYGAKTAASIPTNGGWSGGSNFGYIDGHAKYQKAVRGGDVDQGASDLYAGYFPKAYTRKNVADSATPCPTDRSSKVF